VPTSLTTWLFLTALVLGTVLGVGALLGETPSLDAELHPEAIAPDTADGETLEAEGAGGDFWSLLGVGQVPLGLLLSLDLLLVGGIGIVAGEVLQAWLPLGAASPLTLAAALFTGPALGARIARGIARHLPSVESHGAKRRALVGRFGRAELEIGSTFGRARVRDAGGALHFVRCVCHHRPIPAGVAIVVVDLDATNGVYAVERADQLLGSHEARAGTPSPSL
jgi:hypothetical protein